MTKHQHLPSLYRTNTGKNWIYVRKTLFASASFCPVLALPPLPFNISGERTPLCSRSLFLVVTLIPLCFTLVTIWESYNSLPTPLSNTPISLTLPSSSKASAASQPNTAIIILLPSLLTSTSLSIPLKAIFLSILFAPSSEAASLRPGLNTEYFKRYGSYLSTR